MGRGGGYYELRVANGREEVGRYFVIVFLLGGRCLLLGFTNRIGKSIQPIALTESCPRA